MVFTGGTSLSREMPCKQQDAASRSAAYETEDVLDRFHGLGRDRARAGGAIGKNRIDVDGIGDQTLHLGVDRREFCDRELDERSLEGGELCAAEFGENIRLAPSGQRGMNADEVVGLGPLLEAF